MTTFLYFFPGAALSTIPRARAAQSSAAVALWDLLRSEQAWNSGITCNRCLLAGPGGQTGVMLAATPANGFVEGCGPVYQAKDQTWVPIAATSEHPESIWLGWYTERPPTEESLRRDRVVPGYPVTMLDDRAWQAPTIRTLFGSKLPQRISLGSDGARVVAVQPAYQTFADIAARLWDHAFDATLSRSELLDLAARCLSLNYRVGPREVDALGLFELLQEEDLRQNWWQVAEAAVDWPLVTEFLEQEAAKKKQGGQAGGPAADSCEPMPGSEDATPAAAPSESSTCSG